MSDKIDEVVYIDEENQQESGAVPEASPNKNKGL